MLPIERVDEAVLTALAGDVLRPAVVAAIVDGVFEALQPTTVTTSVKALTKNLRTLDRRIANLTAAIEDGAALALLVTKLQERQTERDALLAAIGAAEAAGQLQVDRRAVERKVLEQVETWTELLATNGRQVLREVLAGPLQFAPVGRTYRFEAEGHDRRADRRAGRDFTLSGVPNGYRERLQREIHRDCRLTAASMAFI